MRAARYLLPNYFISVRVDDILDIRHVKNAFDRNKEFEP